MRVPVSWLREYVAWDGSVEELAELLSMSGSEVEGIDWVGAPHDARQPGALSRGPRAHQGAPPQRRQALAVHRRRRARPAAACTRSSAAPQNFAAGDTVAVSLAGATLENGLKLRKANLRGVESDGMMLSEQELGFEQASPGIVVLPADWPVGAPLPTTCRSPKPSSRSRSRPTGPTACRSTASPARWRRRPGCTLAPPPIAEPPASGAPAAASIAVEIADPDLCARYGARVIRGVTVGESPAWLKARLTHAGMRPINNVVDVTNYVMLAVGQPLHALRRRQDPRRQADRAPRPGRRAHRHARRHRPHPESRQPGDRRHRARPGHRRHLRRRRRRGRRAHHRPGARGGHLQRTEHHAHLQRGRLAQRGQHALREGPRSLLRAARPGHGEPPLLRALRRRGGAGDRRRLGAAARRRRRACATGRASPTGCSACRSQPAEQADILRRLECEVEPATGEAPVAEADLAVTPPPFRRDLERPVDLVEEVGRIHGLENLPETLPLRRDAIGLLTGDAAGAPAHRRHADRRPASTRSSPTRSWPPTRSRRWGSARATGAPTPIALANPMSAEQAVMRTTLLPGLLAAVATNLAHQAERVALFEQGRVYLPRVDDDLPAPAPGPKDTCQPWPVDEPEMLGIALCGPAVGRELDRAPRGRPTSSPSRATSSACWPALRRRRRRVRALARALPAPRQGRRPAARQRARRRPRAAAPRRGGALRRRGPDRVRRRAGRGAAGRLRGLAISLFEDLLTFPPASQDLAVVLDADVPAAAGARPRAPGRRQAAARGRRVRRLRGRPGAARQALAGRAARHALARPHADRQGHHRRAPEGAGRARARAWGDAALGALHSSPPALRLHRFRGSPAFASFAQFA